MDLKGRGMVFGKKIILSAFFAAVFALACFGGCERNALPSRPPVPTQTPVPTGTFTLTPTPVNTTTPTPTATATNSPTLSPTVTPTSTRVILQAIPPPAPPPGGIFSPPAVGVPVLQIQLVNPGTGVVTITGVNLTASGTGDDLNGITQTSLYQDVNGNGILDGGDILLTTATYPADNGVAAFSFSSPIGASVTITLLVTDTFGPAAPNGVYQTGVSINTDMTGIDSSGPVGFTGMPLNGAAITLLGGPTATATASPTATATITPTCGCGVGTITPTPTATPTRTSTPPCGLTTSCTPTITPSITNTATVTPTNTPTITSTPTCFLFCKAPQGKPLPRSL